MRGSSGIPQKGIDRTLGLGLLGPELPRASMTQLWGYGRQHCEFQSISPPAHRPASPPAHQPTCLEKYYRLTKPPRIPRGRTALRVGCAARCICRCCDGGAQQARPESERRGGQRRGRQRRMGSAHVYYFCTLIELCDYVQIYIVGCVCLPMIIPYDALI